MRTYRIRAELFFSVSSQPQRPTLNHFKPLCANYSVLDENSNPKLEAQGPPVTSCTLRTCGTFTVTGATGSCAGNIHGECMLSCDESLYTPASATYVCGADGSYGPKTEGGELTCARKACTGATVPEGATGNCDNVAYGQSCTVACSTQGYQTSVSTTLQCGDGGVFTGAQLATCPSMQHSPCSHSPNSFLPQKLRLRLFLYPARYWPLCGHNGRLV